MLFRDLDPTDRNVPRGRGSFNSEGEDVLVEDAAAQLDALPGSNAALDAWRSGAPLDVSLRP